MWVFRKKKDHTGKVIEYKARLCAQGFSQIPGIDYEQTFAPMGQLNSLRALISFAESKNLHFQQMDVKSAFLNAPLNKVVHLSVPRGMSLDCQGVCLRLNKAIYGLKQALLAWYNRLSNWLVNKGLLCSVSDPCVFY